MAKHDIVVLNSTSSGFETDLGSNVARIKGDADNLFSVRNTSGVDKFDISSIENSMIVSSDLTLTGNLSSSLSSTASFGRIDVTNLTGDASQMTNLNQIGHVSSSKQLASRISGAFEHGFELIGENRVISGSATSTGSFTKVFANVYSGDASDMFDVNEVGHFSSSAQLASNISGSFNKGFTHSGTISGSATSTGSFGRITFAGRITGNAAAVTIDESGFFSGSAQLSSNISGSFNKGFEFVGSISGSSTSTGSFGRVDVNSISGDASQVTGLEQALPAGVISSSAQIASNISGSFTSGFLVNGTVRGVTGVGLSGVWSAVGSAPNTLRDYAASAGSGGGTVDASKSALMFGGRVSPASVTCTEEWNGTTWTETSDLNTDRIQHGGFGTTEAAVAVGSAPYPTNTGTKTEEWNGTNWSEVNDIGTAAGGIYGMSAGTQNSGLIFNAVNSAAPTSGTETYEYNGTNWTAGGDASVKHARGAMGGTQNSAVLFGGLTAASNTGETCTEEYDGTSFSTGGSLNVKHSEFGGDGASAANGLAVGDSYGNFQAGTDRARCTEAYNGSSWVVKTPLPYKVGSTEYQGTATKGITFGGYWRYPNLNSGLSLMPNNYEWDDESVAVMTNTGSFGKYEFGSSISISDISGLIGIPSSEGFFSGSAQLSSQISGAFTEGFEFDGHISGSNATSTGSFSKVVANTYNANASNVTGFTLPSGLASGSAGFASQISGSFKGGFTMLEGGVISSSVKFISSSISSSNSEIGMGIGNDGSTSQSIASASFSVGLANFANLKINDGAVTSISHRTAILSQNILTKNEQDISGSLRGLPRFRQDALISGSATSTGSYARLRAESITAKDIVGDVRKPISGSMGHDTYISASFRSVGTDKPIKIPVRGKIFNSINTRQFTATGSMKDQKYRTQPGQLFVDNFGRLNMTVQTGSMVAQTAAWSTPTPTSLSGRFGGIASKSTTAGAGSAPGNAWKQYDGISVKTIPGAGTNDYGWTTGIQIAGDGVDDMITFSNGFPADYDTMVWNGSAWYKVQKTPINVYSSVVLTQGTQNDSGFIGGQYSGTHGCTLMNWNGTSFHNTGQALITGRYYANGSGTTNAGLVTGGAESASPYPSSTCTEEWNGTTWATGGALGRAQHGGAAGGTQNATTYYGGYPNAYTEEYNGTAWSTGPDGPNATTQAGGSGGAGNMMQSPGLGGTAGIHIFETAYVTGSADTYNKFSQNPSGRYLLTKKLQANLSPSAGGTATTGSSSGYGGGY